MPNPRAQQQLAQVSSNPLDRAVHEFKSLSYPAQALGDMLASTLRGSTAATLGVGGDIRELIDLLGPEKVEALLGKRVMPTTEEMKGMLPKATSYEHPYESIGEFLPLPGTGAALKAAGYGLGRGAGALTRATGQAISDAMIHQAGPLAQGPLSALAPRMAMTNVVKPKGGNWETGAVEKALKPMKRNEKAAENLEEMKRVYPPDVIATMSPETRAQVDRAFPHLEKQVALNNWIDRNLTNYVKKEMGTPEDPIRRLAEEGITHFPAEELRREADWLPERLEVTRRKAGFPAEGMAKSPEAQGWEIKADTAIEPTDVGTIRHLSHLFKKDITEPWMAKVPDETKVYMANDDLHGGYLGFDHILDVLRQDVDSGRIRPEQLSKVSMEQAVRRVHEFDQEQARKMMEAQLKEQEGFPLHKEYPEGYKWIELAKPDLKELPEGYQVKRTSQNLPYLVNPEGVNVGYFDEGAGEAGALSRLAEDRLKEALKYEGDTMGHCVGGYCPDVLEGRSRIFSLRDKKGEPHVTVEVQPNRSLDFNDWFGAQSQELRDEINARARRGEHGGSVYEAPEYLAARAALPPSIKQIKGKQNAAPKEDYLPYVQDFVRSGDWRNVGDIHNTGLRPSADVFNETELGTLKSKGHEVNKYLSQDEIDALQRTFGSTDEGMKAGGKVSISDNPDRMWMEVQDQKFAGGGEVRGYDDGGSIKATPRSEGWGAAADLAKWIEEHSKEQFGYKNPATEVIADFLSVPAIARTLERKAYGEPVTNIGKANVPLLPDDTAETLMAAAPLGKPAVKGAKVAGKAALGEVEKALFGESQFGALNALTPQVMSVYKPHTPSKPDPDVGTRYKKEYIGGLAPRKDLDIEDLEKQKASVKIFPWDATSRNRLISEVSDVPLTKPVLTEGGDEYMLDLEHIKNRIAGASNEGIAKRIQDRTNRAAIENQALGGSGRVYGFSARMGPGAENAATFPADILMDFLKQGELKKKELKALDTDFRNMLFEGERGAFKDMAPVGTPEFEMQLRKGLASDKANNIKGFTAMNLRKALMDRLGKVEYQKRLGYNLPDLTGAVLADELKGVPKGYVGNVAAELDTFAPIRPSKSSAYSHDFGGVYAGSMPNMPLEFLMPNTYEGIYREMKILYPKATPEALRNMTIGAMEKRKEGISEMVSPRSVDATKVYQEGLRKGEFDPNDIKQVYDYMRRKKLQLKLKDGGAVMMSKGGEMSQVALENLAKLKELREKIAPVANAWTAKQAEDSNKYTPDIQQFKLPIGKAAGGEISADDLILEERPL